MRSTADGEVGALLALLDACLLAMTVEGRCKAVAAAPVPRPDGSEEVEARSGEELEEGLRRMPLAVDSERLGALGCRMPRCDAMWNTSSSEQGGWQGAGQGRGRGVMTRSGQRAWQGASWQGAWQVVGQGAGQEGRGRWCGRGRGTGHCNFRHCLVGHNCGVGWQLGCSKDHRALRPHLLNLCTTPTLAQPPLKCTGRFLCAPPLQPLPSLAPIPLVRPIPLAPSPCPHPPDVSHVACPMTVLAVAGLPSATTSVGPWNSATATGLDSDLAQGANPKLCEEGLTASPGAAPERDLVRLLRLKEGSDHRPGGAGPLGAGDRELMGVAPEVLRVLALGVRCSQGEEGRGGGGGDVRERDHDKQLSLHMHWTCAACCCPHVPPTRTCRDHYTAPCTAYSAGPPLPSLNGHL